MCFLFSRNSTYAKWANRIRLAQRIDGERASSKIQARLGGETKVLKSGTKRASTANGALQIGSIEK